MGQTVVGEYSSGLGESAAVWAQRYKADGPCPQPGGGRSAGRIWILVQLGGEILCNGRVRFSSYS